MFNFLYKVYLRHKEFWTKKNLTAFFGGTLLFLLALIIQHFAYNYIDNGINGVHVGDLLLDNLPSVNLDFFIVQGALLSTLLALYLFVAKPKYLPFSVKALALFIIIRSFFISLTHLGANLHQISLNTDSIGFGVYDFLYNAKNDFFFSGHVGAAFLFSLIFWEEKFWRISFLIISLIFAASMILAHMHYSIDIFAAPFITYGIFVIAQKIFVKDFKLIS